MSLRIFAIAGIVLAGAAGLQIVAVSEVAFALIASPAQAANHDEPEADHGEDHAELAPDLADAAAEPETASPAPSYQERIGASADEYSILISLQQRRRELEQWETELETRAQLVDAAEMRVEERLEEIKSVRAEVELLLGQLDEAEEARIQSLVSTYEKMKSDSAARILAETDSDTMMLVVTRMKEANLADILADMPTAQAKRVTELLAARADPRVRPEPESGT